MIFDYAEYLQSQEENKNKLQEEIRHRTKHNKCGLTKCSIVVDLQECSRCKIRQYCCKDHQRSDWSTHKNFCRAPIVDIPGPEVHQCPANYNHNMPHSQRADLAIHIAKQLDQMCDNDMYPTENMELIFGIEMGSNENKVDRGYIGIDFPIGNLMLNVWLFLYKAYFEFETVDYDEDDQQARSKAVKDTLLLFRRNMASALLAGNLPGWFQSSVMIYRNKYKEHPNVSSRRIDNYVEELCRREFKGIKWDNHVHKMLKIWPSPGDPVSPPLSIDPYFWTQKTT